MDKRKRMTNERFVTPSREERGQMTNISGGGRWSRVFGVEFQWAKVGGIECILQWLVMVLKANLFEI